MKNKLGLGIFPTAAQPGKQLSKGQSHLTSLSLLLVTGGIEEAFAFLCCGGCKYQCPGAAVGAT